MTEEELTHTYQYVLHKVSSPTWSFYTDSWLEVYRQLNGCVCPECKSSETFTDDLDGLLDSACGCEFWLEQNITIREIQNED